MNPDLLCIYIQALSIKTQVEGMKAKNQMRLARNENPEYDYEDFVGLSRQLDELAVKAINTPQ